MFHDAPRSKTPPSPLCWTCLRSLGSQADFVVIKITRYIPILDLNILAHYIRRSFIWQLCITQYLLFTKKNQKVSNMPHMWGMLDMIVQAETFKKNIRFSYFFVMIIRFYCKVKHFLVDFKACILHTMFTLFVLWMQNPRYQNRFNYYTITQKKRFLELQMF